MDIREVILSSLKGARSMEGLVGEIAGTDMPGIGSRIWE
jgi:hypothetical protein